MVIEIGPVDSGVAFRAEAGSLRQPRVVVLLADCGKYNLGMAAQAQVVVPRYEHFLVDGAVHLMAGSAALAQGLMLPDKRPTLVFVALKTGFVDIFHRRR